ncbi:MAG: hypothetical protein AAFO01_21965 [Pseudomonadota bacterium]
MCRPIGETIHHLGDCRWFDTLDELWRNDRGEKIDWPAFLDYAALKQMKVVLATAQLDHNPINNRPGNLKALCHLGHDRKEHRLRARITDLKQQALGGSPQWYLSGLTMLP